MKIVIHRGIDQIGGCITEIATHKTRILIDLGQNLPDGAGHVSDPLATREAVGKLTGNVDALFYTHYHGDHLGLFHLVPESVRQYIGATAQKIILRKHQQLSYIKDRAELSAEELAKIERMVPFHEGSSIRIGDITITPYFVSHSAYDSYMFLIEAEGKRMLHTGDFRDHGYLGKGLTAMIRKHILSRGKVDILITEGTMLSRIGEKVKSERELQQEVLEIMRRYKNVFVLCSSTDLERLATFYAANKKTGNRPFVCDGFQKDVLRIFSERAGTKSPIFDFDRVYDFQTTNAKLLNWMTDRGFCMLVRPTEKFAGYWKFLESHLESDQTVMIYSMWKEYVNPGGRHAVPRYLDFVSMFPTVGKVHTSGHASAECLAGVCNLINPTLGIIPIHSGDSSAYAKLPIHEHLQHKVVVTPTTINGIDIEIK